MKKLIFIFISALILGPSAKANTQVKYANELATVLKNFLGKTDQDVSTMLANNHRKFVPPLNKALEELNPLRGVLKSSVGQESLILTRAGKNLKAAVKTGEQGQFKTGDQLVSINIVGTGKVNFNYFLEIRFSEIFAVKIDSNEEFLLGLYRGVVDDANSAVTPLIDDAKRAYLQGGSDSNLNAVYQEALTFSNNSEYVVMEIGHISKIPLSKVSIEDLEGLHSAFKRYLVYGEDGHYLEIPK